MNLRIKKLKKSHYFNINNKDKEIKSFRGKNINPWMVSQNIKSTLFHK